MALGDFTKQESDVVVEAFTEVFKALPKRKQGEYIGHANEIYLFLEAAKRAAPDKPAESTAA
jgi:hypothetical protein